MKKQIGIILTAKAVKRLEGYFAQLVTSVVTDDYNNKIDQKITGIHFELKPGDGWYRVTGVYQKNESNETWTKISDCTEKEAHEVGKELEKIGYKNLVLVSNYDTEQ